MGNKRKIIIRDDNYSTAETAERLGVHPRTIRRMIADGTIRATMSRGSWAIKEKELARIILMRK